MATSYPDATPIFLPRLSPPPAKNIFIGHCARTLTLFGSGKFSAEGSLLKRLWAKLAV